MNGMIDDASPCGARRVWQQASAVAWRRAAAAAATAACRLACRCRCLLASPAIAIHQSPALAQLGSPLVTFLRALIYIHVHMRTVPWAESIAGGFTFLQWRARSRSQLRPSRGVLPNEANPLVTVRVPFDLLASHPRPTEILWGVGVLRSR